MHDALEALNESGKNFSHKDHLPYRAPYDDKTTDGLLRCIHVRLFISGALSIRVAKAESATYIRALYEGIEMFVKIKLTQEDWSEKELSLVESLKTKGGFYFHATNYNDFFRWFRSTVVVPFIDSFVESISETPSTQVAPATEPIEDKVFYTGTELLNLPPEPPMLLEPFIRAYGLWCLAGSSDVGKSMLLRQLAVAIVTGQNEFLGFKLNPRHRRVLIVSTEDDRSSVAQLLELQRLGLDISRLKVSFQSENVLKNLESEIQNEPIDLAILDSLGDLFRGNIKDAFHVRSFLDPYYQLATKYGCAIGFLHHTGKRTEHIAPSKNNLVGSQGLEAKMRIVMELRPDLADETLRHLCVVKSNYLPTALQRESIVLKFDSAGFTFAATGERVPIELLAKPKQNDNFQQRWSVYSVARATGLKGKKLEEATGLNLSQISKLKNEARRQGIDPIIINSK